MWNKNYFINLILLTYSINLIIKRLLLVNKM